MARLLPFSGPEFGVRPCGCPVEDSRMDVSPWNPWQGECSECGSEYSRQDDGGWAVALWDRATRSFYPGPRW